MEMLGFLSAILGKIYSANINLAFCQSSLIFTKTVFLFFLESVLNEI